MASYSKGRGYGKFSTAQVTLPASSQFCLVLPIWHSFHSVHFLITYAYLLINQAKFL